MPKENPNSKTVICKEYNRLPLRKDSSESYWSKFQRENKRINPSSEEVILIQGFRDDRSKELHLTVNELSNSMTTRNQ